MARHSRSLFGPKQEDADYPADHWGRYSVLLTRVLIAGIAGDGKLCPELQDLQ